MSLYEDEELGAPPNAVAGWSKGKLLKVLFESKYLRVIIEYWHWQALSLQEDNAWDTHDNA